MMMSIGMFAFSLPTLAYQELARSTDWRHAASARVGARPANQFVGPGEDKVSLSGTLYAELGDVTSIDQLREMGDQGKAWPLVTGAGKNLGAYIIERVEERQSVFMKDGAWLKTEFGLELRRVDDEAGLADSLAAGNREPTL